MTKSGIHTLVLEPLHYCLPKNRVKATHRYRDVAEQWWCEREGEIPGDFQTEDYAAGFCDGVVDYLTFGGSGAPPLLPPRRYWRLGHRLDRGPAPAEHWFLGFAEGTRMAAASGLRETTQVRSASCVETGYFPATNVSEPESFPEALPAPAGVLPAAPNTHEDAPATPDDSVTSRIGSHEYDCQEGRT